VTQVDPAIRFVQETLVGAASILDNECEWQNPHSDDFSSAWLRPCQRPARVVHCRLPEMLTPVGKGFASADPSRRRRELLAATCDKPVAGRW